MIARSTKIGTHFTPFAMPFRREHLEMDLASQDTCTIFAKLPPELRNQIYEYAFTTDRSKHKALVTAPFKGPENNLLLTCQRIFVEASGIFEVARTAYWKKTTFYINLLSKDMYRWPSACEIVGNLHDRELKLIRKIIINCDCGNAPGKWHLTKRRSSMKGWIATNLEADKPKELSLGGKRNGLYRILDMLS